jgi:hypothetical protein
MQLRANLWMWRCRVLIKGTRDVSFAAYVLWSPQNISRVYDMPVSAECFLRLLIACLVPILTKIVKLSLSPFSE